MELANSYEVTLHVVSSIGSLVCCSTVVSMLINHSLTREFYAGDLIKPECIRVEVVFVLVY